jgi:hypothetical protein
MKRKSHTQLATEKLMALGFKIQPGNSDYKNRYLVTQIATGKFWGVRTLKEGVRFAANYQAPNPNIRFGNQAH